VSEAVARFRLRALPIVVVILLGLGLPFLGAAISQSLSYVLPLPSMHGATLPWLYSQHAAQTLLALVAIFIIKRFTSFDAGLRWPPDKTYLRAAILWGVLFGMLMTVVDYAPDLLARRAPMIGFALTPANVVGWLGFEGMYVGPTEEILFRSLLVGYLIAAMPGTLRLWRYEISWAGVIVALIFALAHITTIINNPSWAAFGQQLYAFALGVLYAYWFEKSRSVLAPVIGHNVSDLTEYAILFTLVAMWS